MRRVKTNPFYQPPRQWQIRIIAERAMIAVIDDVFSDIALAVSSFEVIEDYPEWSIDVITDHAPERAVIDSKLALVSGMHNIPTPSYTIAPLETKDWVSEVERSFPPLNIGRFYIYGSHIQEKPPHGKIPLAVNAGVAFGSGEHATTSGCLLALCELSKRYHFSKPLDMGCGSGILALAMAKLWHARVTAVDIDPVSVDVTRSNAHKNRVCSLIRSQAGDGYHTAIVRKHIPYDVIVANILAWPLKKMAPALAHHLSAGGFAVLSGLLITQENLVLAAHRAQGLKLVRRIHKSGWSTLILSNAHNQK